MQYLTSVFSIGSYVQEEQNTHKLPTLPILPLVDINTLTTWSDDVQTSTDDTAQSSSSSSSNTTASSSSSTPSGRIQFPVNDSLNRKLILCEGDIIGLKG